MRIPMSVVLGMVLLLWIPSGTMTVPSMSDTLSSEDPCMGPSLLDGIYKVAPQRSNDGPIFLENRGQAGPIGGILYCHGEGMSVSFHPDRVVYRLDGYGFGSHGNLTYSLRFLDASGVSPLGGEPVPARHSFYIGDDPKCWSSGVRGFHEVVYTDLWDDIDLRFYFSGSTLKYDVIVRPGGSPDDIAFDYNGVDRVSIEAGSGDLVLGTSLGDLVESAPFAYQETNGARQPIECRYELRSATAFAFRPGGFDTTYPLVIDPAISFSTFIGGTDLDSARDCAVRQNGTVVLVGNSWSDRFPTTNDAFCQTFKYGGYDIVVCEFSADGSELLYSTFIGGNGRDEAKGLFLDTSGCVYVTGWTRSTDFPTTEDAYCSSKNASDDDVFVLKLEANLTALNYSTLLPGNGLDWGNAIWVDGSDCAYITGETRSSDFPTTEGSFNDTWVGGRGRDVFVTKLEPDGSSLNYSTLMNGGRSSNYGTDIQVTDDGVAVVVGVTYDGFPTTEGAYCRTGIGWLNVDAFALKLSSDGTKLLKSTLVSGSEGDRAERMELDGKGAVYMAGTTSSVDFPSTRGAYCESLPLNTMQNLFVLKLSSDLSKLEFSSFLGGEKSESVYDMALDVLGSILLTGATWSEDFPTTHEPDTLPPPAMFITMMDPDASRIAYSVMYGASYYDRAKAVAVDANGSVIIAGETNGNGFPTTTGAYDTTHNGRTDMFLMKLEDFYPPWFGEDLTPSFATTGDNLTFQVGAMDKFMATGVSVEFWRNDMNRTTELELVLASGNATNGTWELNITLSDHNIAPLSYRFTILDRGGFLVTSKVITIPVFDDDPAEVDMTTPLAATTGDPFHVLADVVDNIWVANVSLVYWYGDDTATAIRVGMSNTSVGPTGNGTYEVRNITLPNDSVDPLHLVIEVYDTSGNLNDSCVRVVSVRDDDPISLEVVPDIPNVTNTGDLLDVHVDVWDNVRVSRVRIVFWYGEDTQRATNASDSGSSVDEKGNGRYTFLIQIPPRSLSPLHLRFEAFDGSSRWERTAVQTVEVVDDDPPWFVSDLSDTESYTGGNVTFRCKVDDNIGISSVVVEFWRDDSPPNQALMSGVHVSSRGMGTYMYVLQLSNDSIEPVWHRFCVTDPSGLTNWSTPWPIEVEDLEAPRIIDDGTPKETLKGMSLVFDMSAEDNIGIAEAYVEARFGNLDYTRMAMELVEGRYLHTITIPRWPQGDLVYRFVAKDSSGIWNSTTPKTVLLINAAPWFDQVPSWEVVEDSEATLDLEPYMSDPNDGPENLSIQCDGENVRVEGLTLVAVYQQWVPDHTISVELTDGEDSVLLHLQVRVVDTNGPPFIVGITSPPDGASYEEDEDITLELEYGDPDLPEGRQLTIRWSSNVTGDLGTMTHDDYRSLVINDLPTGGHTIKVTISDGEAEVSAEVNITVKAKETGPPTPPTDTEDDGGMTTWYAALALIVILVVVLAVVYMMRSNKGRDSGPN